MKVAVVVALAGAFLAVAIAIEVSVWTECRADHSWLYCMRVLSK